MTLISVTALRSGHSLFPKSCERAQFLDLILAMSSCVVCVVWGSAAIVIHFAQRVRDAGLGLGLHGDCESCMLLGVCHFILALVCSCCLARPAAPHACSPVLAAPCCCISLRGVDAAQC